MDDSIMGNYKVDRKISMSGDFERTQDSVMFEPDLENPANVRIKNSANALINTDTYRKIEGGEAYSGTCTRFTCDVFQSANIPFPDTNSAALVYDLLSGRRTDPKTKKNWRRDYQPVTDYKDIKSGDLIFFHGEGISELHTAVATSDWYNPNMLESFLYDSGVQVVHDKGESTAVSNEFKSEGFMNRKERKRDGTQEEMFRIAFRYVGDE
jgi:hypothetical protein